MNLHVSLDLFSIFSLCTFISFVLLSLCNKWLHTEWLKTTDLLSHRFCESQVWIQMLWFLCSVSHRLKSRCSQVLMTSEVQSPLPSSRAIGRIPFFTNVELTSPFPCWLSLRAWWQVIEVTNKSLQCGLPPWAVHSTVVQFYKTSRWKITAA